MRLKNLLRSNVAKVGVGVALGAAATYFAPAIAGKATEVRKSVQEYKRKLFPSHGEQDQATDTAARDAKGNLSMLAAGAPGSKGVKRKGILDAILDAIASLFTGRRTA